MISGILKRASTSRRKLRRGARTNNRALIDRYVLPFFDARRILKLADLTRGVLLSWRVDTYEKYVKTEVISARTLNAARQALFVALHHAEDTGLLPHLGHGVKRVAERPAERQIFQLEEYRRLFSVEWPDVRYRTACLLSAATGMRMGEIRGLLIKNVNLEEGYLDVLTSWQDKEGIKPPKWGSERLKVELPAHVVSAIKEVLALHRWGVGPDQFVFFDVDSVSKPIGRTGLEQALRRAIKAADLGPGRTFHSFRHTLVTFASAHLSAAALRDFIGHTNAITTESYQHVTDADRVALRKVQAKILPFKKAQ